MLVHGIRLARQHRLVDLETPHRHDRGIRRDLIAGPEHEDVVHDDLAGGDLLFPAPAAYPGTGGVQEGKPVERRLRPELLHAADDRVGESGEAEQRVLPTTEQQEDEEAPADDPVEQ